MNFFRRDRAARAKPAERQESPTLKMLKTVWDIEDRKAEADRIEPGEVQSDIYALKPRDTSIPRRMPPKRPRPPGG